LKINPKMPLALFGRGMASLMNGDSAGSTARMEAAKVIRPGVAEEFSRYGVKWPR
jgi:hypothetical protein